MKDPLEGLTSSGMIRTGVSTARIPGPFAPLVAAASEEFDELRQRGETSVDAELLLYGSVATGMARAGRSDVDLIMAGVSADAARRVADQLSTTFRDRCRGVEIGVTGMHDHTAPTDESYGLRVFFRHYCVSVAGPGRLRGDSDFAGDAAAARGFNGDIGAVLGSWRSVPTDGLAGLGRGVARKTLLAVAGLASVAGGTWTTDRGTAVELWSEHRPDLADALARLFVWTEVTSVPAADVAAALAPDGVVAAVVEDFRTLIGLWPASQ